MIYTIENDLLKLSVTSFGAQVCSLVRKCDGVEHIWQADAAVWGYHAPILFPHCGKVPGGIIRAKGKDYPSGQHGFARTVEHRFVSQTGDTITLCLESDGQLLEKWPYVFKLYSSFRLEGDTLHHTLRVENPGQEPLAFGIGYHPAYAIPFDGQHSFSDYELRFDSPQSPVCLNCLPTGLVQGDAYTIGANLSRIQIDEALFASDSHCMAGLSAKTLGIYEKDSGRAVICHIADFPYTLIWSKPGQPRFVCIEPWHSLPSWEGSDPDWEKKPAAAILQPGEHWQTVLSTKIVR